MKWLVTLAVALAGSTFLFSEQDKPKDKPAAEKPTGEKAEPPGAADMAKAMADWMKSMQPGEGHKHLEGFIGKWNTVTKMWMAGPGSPPMESPGVSEVKWVLDKRFLMEEHKGQLMGMPYNGMGLMGFDNDRNMYTQCWASNMGTTLLTMTGSRSEDGNAFTFYGQMDEPMLKVYGRTVKYQTKIVDADKHVFTIYDLHASDDYKVIEMTYTRAK